MYAPPYEELFDRIHGSLLAAACGDALGRTVRSMTHEQILEATDGNGITGYADVLRPKAVGAVHLPKGRVSDGTFLLLTVADSLIRTGRFDLVDQGHALVETRFGLAVPRKLKRILTEYHSSGGTWNPSPQRSWQGTSLRFGHSTETAMVELATHIATEGKNGRHPLALVHYKEGARDGSDPAIKIAPLAMVYPPTAFTNEGKRFTDDKEEFIEHAFALSRLTHGDIVPAHGAIAVGTAASTALYAPTELDMRTHADRIIGDVQAVVFQKELSDRLILQYRRRWSTGDILSAKIARAVEASRISADSLRKTAGCGSLPVESVPFAICTAMRHLGDVEAALREAVNAGGDTDSNAAMVGTIVGARVGASRIPAHLVDGLPDVTRHDIEHMSKDLAKLVIKRREHRRAR